jgi:hypothetical protein
VLKVIIRSLQNKLILSKYLTITLTRTAHCAALRGQPVMHHVGRTRGGVGKRSDEKRIRDRA